MKKVLTIIVSYNFEPWLTKCLDSLLQSTYPTDIFVIDNASSDHTVARIQQDYPQVILRQSDKNLGFGRANNLGFDYAITNRYDVVFLVNQDAWVQSSCLQHLMEEDYGPNVGIVSPMHYDGTGEQLDQGFAGYIKAGQANLSSFPVPFVNAAFWLIPVPVLKQVGLFAPIFYHYGEDSDYANRIKYHGMHLIVSRRAIAYHDRQNRNNVSRAQFFQREYIYFLTEYANVNHSFFSAFAYGVVAPIKKAFLRSSSSHAGLLPYLAIAFKVLAQTAAVYHTRKRNA
ncbi:glycosyltransferase family 2 protein [Sphingobacterium sp. lm-10]|uniref:glycosyltransferase family 2 protein n=1 Tax=Sphingobacterium sp. lm-10 TaxID=2944904 RepID=UPI002020BE72|nr:glycosyltransferase family 2 protein [Sphingobacterium sp. lm-10]MCL7988555.1 glycosyltransferase family 2 protein [Sphingobacterium sp. lm-10]